MKVSDYVAHFLATNGVRHVFGLQGGAVVHLFDSIENGKNICAVYCHHEQAAALAATSYAKATGGLGAAVITTGPGCTNALTGLLAAWQDSVPVMFISGQTRLEHTSYGKAVRQVGSQEFNILDIVRPITKYAALLRDSAEIDSVLQEAYSHALCGRMGPVWVDVPVNLQWESPDLERPCRLEFRDSARNAERSPVAEFHQLLELLRRAEKPVLIAGNGIRAAGCQEEFLNFSRINDLPFVSSWTASDLTATGDPFFGGIIGVCGQRGANKILYEADLIVCLGTHLGLTQSGTLFNEFAPNAKKAIIDFDKGELDNLNVNFNLKIHADIRDFFAYWRANALPVRVRQSWAQKFSALKALNSVINTLTEKSNIGDDRQVNSNFFNFMLTREIPADASVVVDGGGTGLYTGFQSSVLKKGQRIICSSSISAMGTGLPEAVGACFGLNHSTVYCLIGDGSLMLNIQELQTIFHHKLPIKVIVFNNGGYLAIRHTQKSFLGGRYFGTDLEHGVSIPAIERIADCFGIDVIKVDAISQVEMSVKTIVYHPGPLLVEVVVPKNQEMLFQQGYRQISPGRFQPIPLSEMAPFV